MPNHLPSVAWSRCFGSLPRRKAAADAAPNNWRPRNCSSCCRPKLGSPYEPPDMSSPVFHAGMVAMVGRPNVGKSTLVNALVGRKVTIVTAKPQTTRHRILGVVNRPDAQLVLVDTPGLHETTRRMMNQYMNRVAISSVRDADVILMVIEALRFTEEDVWVWERVRGLKQPLFLVVNKVDRVAPKNLLLPFLDEMTERVPVSEI